MVRLLDEACGVGLFGEATRGEEMVSLVDEGDFGLDVGVVTGFSFCGGGCGGSE